MSHNSSTTLKAVATRAINSEDHASSEPLLDLIEDVKRITRQSRSNIYNLMRQGKFPQQVSFGGKRVYWVHAEVVEWVRNQIQEARTDTAAPKPPRFARERKGTFARRAG